MKDWNGPEDGLPPVGETCKYYWWEGNEWRGGEIVAHHHGAAIVVDIHDSSAERLPSNCFRPIRTERDRAIEKIADNLTAYRNMYINNTDLAERLYEAGIRPVEVDDERCD